MGRFNPPVTTDAKTTKAALIANARIEISKALNDAGIRHRLGTGKQESIMVLVGDARRRDEAKEIVAAALRAVAQRKSARGKRDEQRRQPGRTVRPR